MSVDDRLSPQSSSSQSPPPHTFNLMMQAHHYHQQQQQHQDTIKNLFFQQKNISPIQKEMSLHMLNQASNILNLSSSSLPSSPSSSSRLSLSPSPSLKNENPLKKLQRDHIVSDDDDDDDQEIEVDDDYSRAGGHHDHDEYRKSIIANTINFSISNILSDTFGKRELSVARTNTRNLLFRPYDLNINNHSDNSNNNNHISENSNKTTKLSSSLGGLCKTISQIGQHVQQTIVTSGNFSLSNSSMLPLSRTVSDSGVESSDDTRSESGCSSRDEKGQELWPAWVYCTRYSDRPSSGPRYRRPKQPKEKGSSSSNDDKRPRTAFSSEQLARLKQEFNENRYLTERRRQQLSNDLGLNEAQIKIWFQNKRAKIKKSSGQKNPLAMQLMAQGLYNHTTVPLTKEEEELEMRMNGQL